LPEVVDGILARNSLRTREIAAIAGIDTGTLHYHFPSKETLIQAVVDHLANSFQVNRAQSGAEPVSVLEELRNEILDAALRARESPDQIRVMFDLRVRASRDAAVAEILTRLDQGCMLTCWAC
jgi:AcrR family transcriptional regulator